MAEIKTTQQEASAPKMGLMALAWKWAFNHQWMVKNIPFFLFLSFLAVLYIYNGHLADKLTRRIGVTEKHIRELEFEHKTVKAEVIGRSKASALAKVVEPLGLKELAKPPVMLEPAQEP